AACAAVADRGCEINRGDAGRRAELHERTSRTAARERVEQAPTLRIHWNASVAEQCCALRGSFALRLCEQRRIDAIGCGVHLIEHVLHTRIEKRGRHCGLEIGEST